MRGRRCAQAVPERKAKASTLARRLRGSLVSSRPGGVGAPPGDTTILCQELADGSVRSFAVRTLASGTGQIPGHGLK